MRETYHKIKIELETVKAAFDDPSEVGRLLKQLGLLLEHSDLLESLAQSGEAMPLKDINGNKVGEFRATEHIY